MSTANDLREVASSCGMLQCTHLDWRIAHSFMNHVDYDTVVEYHHREDDTQWWTFVLIVAEALDGGRQQCEWAQDPDLGWWETGCENVFELTEGTPKENKMAYCCYCGGKVKETK